MKVSVILPMYNEEDNVLKTLHEVDSVVRSYEDYEIIVVDDGSSDSTSNLTDNCISSNSHVKLLKHPVNMGMGRALRTGFEKAEGDVVVTLDADLSYDPSFIPKLVNELEDERVGIVIGSQYMEGGKTEGIPRLRLFISKSANKIVGKAMKGDLSTVTGVLRAYRKEVLDSMELDSEGTEINPEILSKATAVGFKVKEVPVTLKSRKLGKSKVKIGPTTKSHLLFTFHEKPMLLFGVIGFTMFSIGFLTAIYLVYLYLSGALDPTRPLMTFMLLMIISGIQIVMFGFIATQISLLKREIYIVQKDNKWIKKKLK